MIWVVSLILVIFFHIHFILQNFKESTLLQEKIEFKMYH